MSNNDRIKIITNTENFRKEIFDLANLFFPFSEIQIIHKQIISENEVIHQCLVSDGQTETSFSKINKLPKFENSLSEKKILKFFLKQCVYFTLSKHTKKELPWGFLTGVHPTAVAYDLLFEGVDKSVLTEFLIRDFLVSSEKAKLLYEVIKNQNCIIRNDHLVDLYINIPICPSRCNYCSFISSPLEEVKNLIPNYLDALIKEIQWTKKLINEKSFIVRTIYIGGGTPTILSPEELDLLLSELSYPVSEFTVECGRADTITEEKLKVLKKHGVTRISINPQTFNSKTLKCIGRNHNNEQVFSAYLTALKYDFILNMDLIAGFLNETLSNFKKSVDTALELSPHNLTIHTLAYKKAAEIKPLENVEKNGVVSKMISYANEKLFENGYKPYYLYRQKNMAEALENVGWMRDNHVCIFNIDSTEETLSILACGANAITKRVFGKGGKIERVQNAKFIEEYIKRVEEMCEKKKELFK